MTIPSHRSTLDTAALGRIARNMGTTTVGPVTTIRAPNRAASSQPKPTSQ